MKNSNNLLSLFSLGMAKIVLQKISRRSSQIFPKECKRSKERLHEKRSSRQESLFLENSSLGVLVAPRVCEIRTCRRVKRDFFPSRFASEWNRDEIWEKTIREIERDIDLWGEEKEWRGGGGYCRGLFVLWQCWVHFARSPLEGLAAWISIDTLSQHFFSFFFFLLSLERANELECRGGSWSSGILNVPHRDNTTRRFTCAPLVTETRGGRRRRRRRRNNDAMKTSDNTRVSSIECESEREISCLKTSSHALWTSGVYCSFVRAVNPCTRTHSHSPPTHPTSVFLLSSLCYNTRCSFSNHAS